jgi:hypothetical protein
MQAFFIFYLLLQFSEIPMAFLSYHPKRIIIPINIYAANKIFLDLL